MLSFCCWVKCLYYYYITTQLVVKSLWQFFKISRNAAFGVDPPYVNTITIHRDTDFASAFGNFFYFFSSSLASCLHSTTCVAKKSHGSYPAIAYIRYTRARVRWPWWCRGGRGGGRGGAVVAVGRGRGRGGRGRGRGRGGRGARWPITTHDTFISIRARNAQYSTALPYVKPRQIAKNRLVFPNLKLVANSRSRKVVPCRYIS